MKKHIEEMIGRKFNFLTVLSHYSREKGYLCQCDCGKTTIVKTYSLKIGRQISCGCAPRRIRPENIAAKNEIYRRYKQAAERRGHIFTLTKEEFINLIMQNCYYCGDGYSLGSPLARHKDFFHNGIDRVDNNLGYTNENCVPCCAICNKSKSTLSLEEWMKWLKRIAKFQNLQGSTTRRKPYTQASGNGSYPKG